MTTNFKLRRGDGQMYLSRRGWECKRFGIYLHNIAAEDPSSALHDHPWTFKSLVLWDGYDELIAPTRHHRQFEFRRRKWLSFNGVRLDQCHTIVSVKPNTWTLVFRGRRVRKWGFYKKDGWVYWEFMPREERDLSYEEIG